MTNETREHYEREQRIYRIVFWISMAISLTGGVLYLWKLL